VDKQGWRDDLPEYGTLLEPKHLVQDRPAVAQGGRELNEAVLA
jgi:hypothetical protein